VVEVAEVAGRDEQEEEDPYGIETMVLDFLKPMGYPGSSIWEEAMVTFCQLARRQGETDDPSLVNVDMMVSSTVNLLYWLIFSL